jgi:hypothetical protein
MPSEWNMFVKKIYQEGKSENPDYEFKQALIDASKRKSEMKNMSLKMGKKHFKNKKMSMKNKKMSMKNKKSKLSVTRRRNSRNKFMY